jgi:hypothetical protein
MKTSPNATINSPHHKSGCRLAKTLGAAGGFTSEYTAEIVIMTPMAVRRRPTKYQMDFIPDLYQK